MGASINFKAVLDAIPHATVLLSRDFTMLRANVAALSLACRRVLTDELLHLRDAVPNSSACNIAETIIVIVHKLDLKVIAEDVEAREQHDWLREAGCDYAQGYLFSKPVPPPEFEHLLGEQCVASLYI